MSYTKRLTWLWWHTLTVVCVCVYMWQCSLRVCIDVWVHRYLSCDMMCSFDVMCGTAQVPARSKKCMYIHMYTYIYILHIYIYVYIYIYIHRSQRGQRNAYIYVYTHTFIYIYIYIYIYVCIMTKHAKACHCSATPSQKIVYIHTYIISYMYTYMYNIGFNEQRLTSKQSACNLSHHILVQHP